MIESIEKHTDKETGITDFDAIIKVTGRTYREIYKQVRGMNQTDPGYRPFSSEEVRDHSRTLNII
jgi:hypothetical protein